MNYWLMKSEPDVFSIDDLREVKKEPWDGVRNYQARNFMRDDMKVGDKILFYHSNCAVTGVYGVAEVSKAAFPDHTAFDPDSKYYDAKSSLDNPRWVMVEVKFVKKFKNPMSLKEIKEHGVLKHMLVAKKGQRLSIQPVEKKHFVLITKLSQ